MKYSVIMPTYNCEKYVEEAIKSVLCQSFSDFELIIIDDGSSDNTVATITAVISGDNRARIITKEHAGVSAARHRGIDEAKGEYLLFIDGDDTWHNDLLLECDKAISGTNLFIFDILRVVYCENGEVRKLDNPRPETLEICDVIPSENTDEFFSAHNLSSPCNKIYRRSIVEKHNIYFDCECCYLEDLKFNFDYLSHVSSARIYSKNLYYYRLFETNQINKRSFAIPFVNADAVYTSAINFLASIKKDFGEVGSINGLLLSAYFNEFAFWANGKDEKKQIELLNVLNKSKGYADLLKNMQGKACKLLRVFRMLNLKRAQIKLIKKRFL